MDATELIRLLNTDHYSPANLEEVNDLCRNYPMFNLAHALKVRVGTALGNPVEDALRIAAVYAVDRSRLYQLVNEVKPGVQEETVEEDQEETDGIQFSEEISNQADVIIVQHAPYAAPPEAEADETLLELDEEEPQDETGEEPEEEPGEEPGEEPEEESKVEPGEEPEEEPEEESKVEPGKPTGERMEAEAQDEGQEEEPGESVEEEELELSSEDLVGVVVKDEADMEEPMPEGSDIPAIDVVEPDEEEKEGSTEEMPVSESQRLIEQFIRGEPGPIRADRVTSLKGDVSVASIREHDGFITDTLAKIYVKQGLYAKAIYAYEKLSLKYPEKSAYFAAQIEKIKNITQS